MPRLPLIVSLLLTLIVGLASPAARAADADAAEVARARADYELGTRYWDVGQYEKALEAYRSAYAHRADPALLFNVGQCLRKLRRLNEALDAYRTFLRRAPRSPKRPDVERMMKAIEDELAAAPAPIAPPPLRPVPIVTPPPPPPAQPAMTLSATPAEETTPIVRRPWFWGVGAVVVAGAVTAILLATRHTDRAFICDGCVGSSPVPAR